jgi:hypothetical protein
MVVVPLREAPLPGGFRLDLPEGGMVDMVVRGTGAGVLTVDVVVVLVPLGVVSVDTVGMMDSNEVVAEGSGMGMATDREEADLTTDEAATGTEMPDLTTIETTLMLLLETLADPVIDLDAPRPMSDDPRLVVAPEAGPSPVLDPTLVRLLLDPEGGEVDRDPARVPFLAQCLGAGAPRELDHTRGAFRGLDPDPLRRDERGEPRGASAGVEVLVGAGARSEGSEELARAGVPVEAEAGAEARSRPSELRWICERDHRVMRNHRIMRNQKPNKTMVERSTSLVVFSHLRFIKRNTRSLVVQSHPLDY